MHLELVCPLFSTAKPSKIRSFPTNTGIITASKFPTAEPLKTQSHVFEEPQTQTNKNDKKQKGSGKAPPTKKQWASNHHQTKPPKNKQQPQQNKTTGFQFRISIPYPPTRRLRKKKDQQQQLLRWNILELDFNDSFLTPCWGLGSYSLKAQLTCRQNELKHLVGGLKHKLIKLDWIISLQVGQTANICKHQKIFETTS